jgi:hypothetical protein
MAIDIKDIITGGSPIGFTGSQGAVGFTGSIGFTGSQGDTGPTSIPENSQTSGYTLQLSDVGKFVNISSGNVTIPADIFGIGDVITIYNNSTSTNTIVQGSSTTVRFAGTSNTGNRSLSQRGLCTILCVASNEFVVSGAGVF